MVRPKWTRFLFLSILLVVVAFVSMGIGPSWVSSISIYKVRFPRVVLGIFAGSSLALIGAALAIVLRIAAFC